MGLGAGLFAMVVVGVVGALCAVVAWGRSPKYAGAACAATVGVVLALAIFFAAAPHAPPGANGDEAADEAAVYDHTALPRILVGVLLLVLLVVACFFSLAGAATPVHVA